MKFVKSLVLSVASLAVVACNSQSMPINPALLAAQRNVQMRAPGPLQAMSAAQSEAQLFSAHFVNAYAETIAQNEPLARRDPNGPAQEMFKLIASARQTLDAAFYDIGDMGVAKALIDAKAKGIRVRVVTDTDNMTPMSADKGQTELRETIAALKQAGIPVVDDQRSGIMHHKFLIVDNQAVWMGSTNSSTSSLYNHNNNALTIRNAQIAENYFSEFERMFTQRIFGPNPARQIPHPVVKVGNTTIRTFFSPKGGGTEAIMDVLNRAQKSISFMTFSFTDKDVANLMVAKKNAGLRVEGVYDQCLGYGQYSTYHIMKANGIYTRMDGNEALLHHKVIIADDTVITGSFNISANADKTNNESMLIIENNYVASAYNAEYKRVMTAAQNNNPPRNRCPGQSD